MFALCVVVAVATACGATAGAVQATVIVTSQVSATAEPMTVTADPETVTAPGTTEVRTTTRTMVTTAPATTTAPPTTTASATTSSRTTTSRTTVYDPAKDIYLSKSIGSQARLVSQDGVRQLQAFTVNEIRPNFVCTSPNPAEPGLGRYLGVRVSNEISVQYRPGIDPTVIRMSRVSMKVTSGGVTTDYLDGAPDGCLRDQDRVNPSTAPGTKSVGWIVLDTKDIHGTLYLDYPPGHPGWKWDY
ncbi:MAG: hypothetical protein WKF57_11465 [Nakamurella sp.]